MRRNGYMCKINSGYHTGFSLIPSVSSPEELALEAMKILNSPPLSREYMDWIVGRFFAPVTRESIELFVPSE